MALAGEKLGWKDGVFCFLACLPRATIQGALGALPLNQRFFQALGLAILYI